MKTHNFVPLLLKKMKMMKKGLILEGGAMRGLFTAGILDVMMKNGLRPDGIVGVSAGACFGCNFKSHQIGRAIRYNKRFARDSRYCSLSSLLKSGDIFNAEFAYHIVPTLYDPFDSETFEADPMEFHLVCTDVLTGKPVYKNCTKGGHYLFDWVRASASMPLVSNIVEIDGYKLLDGGMTDSIPLQYFENKGYNKNIVILTQPEGYVKKQSRAMPLISFALRKYPAVVEAMRTRYIMYNEQLKYVREAEKCGKILVIRPNKPIPIGHICHNPEQMQAAYDMGFEHGERHLEEMLKFWK